MLLLLLLIISLFAQTLVRFSALEKLEFLTYKSHLFCLQNLPASAEALSELKALVCAENFTSLAQSKLYITSGLIHLFVVSGAHLILIEKFIPSLFKKTQWNHFFKLSLLVAYGFMCALIAPITRSLIAMTLSLYLHAKKIHWPISQKILITGLLCLNFNYQWIHSFSLQMSWLAAFAVSLAATVFKNRSQLFKQSLFFMILLPTVVYFQIPSPLAVLLNIFLAPALEFLLFPLGLLVWFFNFLHPVFDVLISVFNSILQKTEIDFQIQKNELPSQLVLLNWVLILGLHFALHMRHVSQQRKQLADEV